jgi:D-beta-D-heptose 7-phosphate kinase/D-beta-D-heptose 1-phosphate adenosyltransferase
VDRLSLARVERLLDAAAGVRVLVVGDVMLDRYITGSVDRISPEAPVPVVRVEHEASALGGAANVAANVAALGAKCVVVGCAGRDADGEVLRRELEALGVATDGLVLTEERPTTVKTRILARRQQVVRFDHEVEADASPGLAEALSRTVASVGRDVDVVVLEDYNKGVLVPSVIRIALDTAGRTGAPTVVDPKRRNFFEYGGATVFKPNAKELADALGEFIHPDEAAWMEATRRRLGCANLLLTLGERGMALQTAEEVHVRVPTAARAVYDVSGAGDTVTAMMAVGLASGATTAEAALLANHAAAIEVGKAGVATVSPEEILLHARDYRDKPHETEEGALQVVHESTADDRQERA